RQVAFLKGSPPDLSELLYRPNSKDAPRKMVAQNHHLEKQLDHALLAGAEPAIAHGQAVILHTVVCNRDRAVGTLLSSEITRRRAGVPLDDDSVRIEAIGSAGQSLGAFLAAGITLRLEGEANDYVGKGLSGGKLIVKVPAEVTFAAEENMIVGNVVLYGATSGQAYFNGLAGERFAVRNSGAIAVVEGIGDHGCEYMTGGVVLILGSVGKNFAAGMSGGEAYVYDENGEFTHYLNRESVRMLSCSQSRDILMIRRLLENHGRYTGSVKAQRILEDWPRCAMSFIKVIPNAYATVVDQNMAEGKDIRPSPPPAPANVAVKTGDMLLESDDE
ncbi:MAG: glutamate synthase subunit alpha, partial [Gammaproteobacteria bacterium]|nr:glutamate synthase subunit alpha [Gammaproteobacteria bacterium]